ncbi:MAG: peptidylprolyl isomerase [Planctomycetota bacterium]|jgi:hypothetical protein
MTRRLALFLLLPVMVGGGVSLPGCAVAVARVNGETITRSELYSGIPEGTSDPRLEEGLKAKLPRLVDLALRRQILHSEGIRVPEEEVEAVVRKHYKNPPPVSCACCRARSLEEVLRNHLMTRAEYAETVRTSLGLQKLVDREWRRAFGSERKFSAEIEREKQRLLKDYVKVSEILFTKTGPEKGGPVAKARNAWERLSAGEDFHALAKALSENEESGLRGGERGCLLFLHFLPEFRKVLQALRPGEFTKPLRTFDGMMILLRQPIGDTELGDLLRDEFERKTYLTTLRKAHAEARIEILWGKGG